LDLSGGKDIPLKIPLSLRLSLLRTPPALVSRLRKAVALVEEDAVRAHPSVAGAVLVSSSTQGEVYCVTSGACECGDAVLRGSVCKHRLARRIFLRLRDATPQWVDSSAYEALVAGIDLVNY
jgi:hypothetical protein